MNNVTRIVFEFIWNVIKIMQKTWSLNYVSSQLCNSSSLAELFGDPKAVILIKGKMEKRGKTKKKHHKMNGLTTTTTSSSSERETNGNPLVNNSISNISNTASPKKSLIQNNTSPIRLSEQLQQLNVNNEDESEGESDEQNYSSSKIKTHHHPNIPNGICSPELQLDNNLVASKPSPENIVISSSNSSNNSHKTQIEEEETEEEEKLVLNQLDKLEVDSDNCNGLMNYEVQHPRLHPTEETSPNKDQQEVLNNGNLAISAEHLDKELIDHGIQYVSYESELQMSSIMKLIQKDLSEPYSVYTYRYFIHNWPKLCFLAMDGDKMVGVIVCKLDVHKQINKRGYIAMLAVDENYRRKKIGSNLVLKSIRAMAEEDADEIVLETEITNKSALRLYENLGFVRDKRLFRYYLNGVDALRLKLWLNGILHLNPVKKTRYVVVILIGSHLLSQIAMNVKVLKAVPNV
ncbi:unnamed protein product [Allacma fusca]|uniref:N-terminal methionine N(alpha)-acetyltransferase NatC n=1 Tax=Allacma fusca TaxID=39272 RepID=A0A8J2P9E7_9HEXA|nr:unnamed protein product [Allacma fusca]